MSVHMSDMAPLATVAVHTVVIYLFLIVAMRVFSRRQMGQLSAIDLVIVILLGSAVETAMVNADTHLIAGIVSAATLMVVNRILAALFRRNRSMQHLVCADPIILIHDGQYVEDHLRRIGMTREDVLQALRAREQPGPERIRYAVLEADGEINVVLMNEKHHRGGPVAPSPETV